MHPENSYPYLNNSLLTATKQRLSVTNIVYVISKKAAKVATLKRPSSTSNTPFSIIMASMPCLRVITHSPQVLKVVNHLTAYTQPTKPPTLKSKAMNILGIDNKTR